MTTRHEADQAEKNLSQKRLLLRMGVALALIVVLLAGLFLFEQGETPPAPAAPARAPLPQVVMGQVQSVSQTAVQKPPTPPETTEATEKPPVPAVTGETAPSAPKLAAGVEAKPGPARTHTTVAATPAPTPAAPAPVPSQSATPIAPSPTPAAPVTATPPKVSPGAAQGYLLQVGGLGSVAEAEALRAKLLAAGIPAQIEARVRVGPYPSKDAASAAQSRIQALGLDASLVIPLRK